MKKRYLFLMIPAAFALLVGCKDKKGSGPQSGGGGGDPAHSDGGGSVPASQSSGEGEDTRTPEEKDIDEAANLPYIEGYGDNLGSPLDDTLRSYFVDHAYDMVLDNMTSMKFVGIERYASENPEDPIASQETTHEVMRFYRDGVFTSDAFEIDDTIYPGGVVDSKKSSWHTDEFYNSSHKVYIEHTVDGGGHHRLNASNWSSEDEEGREAAAEKKFHDAVFKYFSLDDMTIYGTETGYVGYFAQRDIDRDEDPQMWDLEGWHAYQVIFEFDDHYCLTKGTIFEKYFSDYNVEDPMNSTCFQLTSTIYEPTYGERESGTAVISEVEDLYGKPFFSWGTLNHPNAGGTDVVVTRRKDLANLQTLHIDASIWMKTFRSQKIDITPEIKVYYYRSLYETARQDQTWADSSVFEVEESEQLSFEDGKIYLSMDSINDAVFFQLDLKFERENLIVEKATAKMSTKAETEAFFGYSL